MDQTANDPSSLIGESSRGAGSVCYIYSITSRYCPLMEKARIQIAPEPPCSAKKKVFVIVLHEGLTK